MAAAAAAAVYADHPFPLITTPNFKLLAPKDTVTPSDGPSDSNKKPDVFDDCASEMACVHNIIMRGLNSIYLQAPHIKTSDQKSFLNYVMNWHKLLHVHHRGEEEGFFPDLEAMAGEKGILEANVTQHKAFHDGVDSFKGYVGDVQAGKQKYDGKRIQALIDGFGQTLVQHLADEIPSLQNLRSYGEGKMAGYRKRCDKEGEDNMKAIGTAGLCFVFANMDVHYEDDLWKSFPPAPAPVKFLVRNVFWWMNADQWKFAACDRQGKLRPLYAVPVPRSA
ncbi:hemerythrin HHE cation binding domain-containing protein [Diplogelasinospora grovesii]|uniref:Hemerythrin HHE cation binding domain-containing protein n=1 Tax=Diplogelasinospora grovesii TaxID=303347 RepID=A0AAN6S1J0_9PEZI|nr:hemerythrin HHE cation binding domain-containing protein [Diplogelasinospora grovesii]